MWIWEIWGNFFKNRYFANNCWIKVQIWEFFCKHVTHVVVVIFCTAKFVSTESNFSYLPIFLPNFTFFSAKSPRVTQRLNSQENAFKNGKHKSPFVHKTIGLNNSCTLIWNNFRFLRYLIVWIQCNSTLWPIWAQCIQLWRLKFYFPYANFASKIML